MRSGELLHHGLPRHVDAGQGWSVQGKPPGQRQDGDAVVAGESGAGRLANGVIADAAPKGSSKRIPGPQTATLNRSWQREPRLSDRQPRVNSRREPWLSATASARPV